MYVISCSGGDGDITYPVASLEMIVFHIYAWWKGLAVLNLSLLLVAHGQSGLIEGSLSTLSPAVTGSTPVVYVIFGKTPDYVRLNAELAARNNHVIIIEEGSQQLRTISNPSVSNFTITYDKLDLYMKRAREFEPLYVHMSRNKPFYEKSCFMRWFVLLEFMEKHNIKRSFYGDGDSSVFASMQAAFDLRGRCDACINIEQQGHKFHWVGAGESSLWTVPALRDFCAFVMAVYKGYVETLRMKFKHSFVVDMSLLWLWWVSNKIDKPTGIETGRPYSELPGSSTDEAFDFAKKLRLPNVDKTLTLCNGLDVVNRTSFDHFHGWTNAPGFNFDVAGGAVPYFVGITTKFGGQPESQDPEVIEKLKQSKLFLLNIHYQGDSKLVLPHDVCKVLLFTGSRSFCDPTVKELCDSATDRKPLADIPCVIHSDNNACL